MSEFCGWNGEKCEIGKPVGEGIVCPWLKGLNCRIVDEEGAKEARARVDEYFQEPNNE